MKITFDGIRVNRWQFSTSCTVSPGINFSAWSNYEAFAIKCCSMYDPNESSAVYLLTSDDKYAVCGMDFSPESTSLPQIFSGGDFRSPAGQRKRSTFTDMQLWDLET